MSKVYKHNKTGNLYELVTDNFFFKDNAVTNDGTFVWRDGLILYRALYDNADGEFFARTREDFFNNFTKFNND